MRKKLCLITLFLAASLCFGCGEESGSSVDGSFSKVEQSADGIGDSLSETESSLQEADSSVNQDESSVSGEGRETDLVLEDNLTIDFEYDYTKIIEADVERIVEVSSILQEELANLDRVIQKFNPLAEAAQTQGEMNVSSNWFYVIWDTELNSLWSRFSEAADQETKDRVLAEQRNWISMKDEVTLLALGSREENGSMYSMLVNSFWEEKTKHRAYVLAGELAAMKGENFSLPAVSEKYGLFIDNQGTGEVYSSLNTRQNYEGEDEAVIGLYRLGELQGTFADNGNGNLSFTSEDGNVKGTIQVNGWKGASFEVTEAAQGQIVSVGDRFEFPMAY